MASDYNVIYIDDDGRNAMRPVVQDNRPRTIGTGLGLRPGFMVPASSRPTVIQTRPVYAAPSYAPAPAPTAVYYQQPMPTGPASMFGNLTGADLAELLSLGIAVLRPLPDAPPAQGDVETDVENLILYQTALAVHAKRDEQIRALGTLASRLVRK